LRSTANAFPDLRKAPLDGLLLPLNLCFQFGKFAR